MIVSSVWIGDRLSKMERLTIKSHQANGHTFRLYAYGTPEGLPPGVDLADASAILPASSIFRSVNGAVGDFANYFKYRVLLAEGGCWTEMDEVCLRPWDDLPASYVSTEAAGSGPSIIDQAAIQIGAGHPLLAALVESCERRIKEGPPYEWSCFGVGTLQLSDHYVISGDNYSQMGRKLCHRSPIK